MILRSFHSLSKVLLGHLDLLQLLVLLLGQAYLGVAGVQARQPWLLHELVLAGRGAVLQLGGRLMVMLSCNLCSLRCKELSVLTRVLHALQLGLRTYILTAFGQPFLHDKTALFSSL